MDIKFKSVGAEVALKFIIFDTENYKKLKKLSQSWKSDIIQAVDEFSNPIENSFVKTYFEHLFFK